MRKRLFWVLVTIVMVFSVVFCSCEKAVVPTAAIDEVPVLQEQQEENALLSQLRKVKYGMTPAEIRVLEGSDPVTTSVLPGEGGRKATYITTDYRDTLYGKYTCKITYGFRDVGEVFGGLFDNKYALTSVRYYIPNATYEDFRFFKEKLIDEHGEPTYEHTRVPRNEERAKFGLPLIPIVDGLEIEFQDVCEWQTTKTRNYYINFLFRFELQSDHGIERADPTPRGKWVIAISQHLYLLN